MSCNIPLNQFTYYTMYKRENNFYLIKNIKHIERQHTIQTLHGWVILQFVGFEYKQ